MKFSFSFFLIILIFIFYFSYICHFGLSFSPFCKFAYD